MIETAREGSGKVGVVVPHGVLFRGGAEGKIRTALIQENLLEAVIGLPQNLFFGTGIPTAILIFNKGKTSSDVLFIDAAKELDDGKNQNRMTVEHLDKIVQTFEEKETIDRYSYRATPLEIADNDYNLNIPRYVDTFEEEEEVDLPAVKRRVSELEDELVEVQGKMKSFLEELSS